MSRYYYFKSRPGVIWVLVKETGMWMRTLIMPHVIEPNVDTLRGMNKIGGINGTH